MMRPLAWLALTLLAGPASVVAQSLQKSVVFAAPHEVPVEIARPARPGPFPAVLDIHDARRGFQDEDRAHMRELAAQGFAVRAPDWQKANMIERWPDRHDPENEDGVEAGLNALLARKDVCKGPVGIVALSHGPYFAIRVAAKRPQDIAARKTGSVSASATCTASGGNAAGGALEEHIVRANTLVKIAAKPRAGGLERRPPIQGGRNGAIDRSDPGPRI